MSSSASWLIIVGFVLLMVGVILRTIVMMRSSDATSSGMRALHGRELIVQYRKIFPGNTTPLVTRWFLISGTVLLLAGLSVEFTH
jgi:hypothetical protein